MTAHKMEKCNRLILWPALITPWVVLACLRLPFIYFGDDTTTAQIEVITAVSLFLAYLFLVIAILLVGGNTHRNLTLRREDDALQTRRNRWHFYAGVAFCVLALAFIFFPLL